MISPRHWTEPAPESRLHVQLVVSLGQLKGELGRLEAAERGAPSEFPHAEHLQMAIAQLRQAIGELELTNSA
jgi:hypothetical protein